MCPNTSPKLLNCFGLSPQRFPRPKSDMHFSCFDLNKPFASYSGFIASNHSFDLWHDSASVTLFRSFITTIEATSSQGTGCTSSFWYTFFGRPRRPLLTNLSLPVTCSASFCRMESVVIQAFPFPFHGCRWQAIPGFARSRLLNTFLSTGHQSRYAFDSVLDPMNMHSFDRVLNFPFPGDLSSTYALSPKVRK
ncbi:hypothetical protein T05_6290 [Trichinella murrelli]|uniref:Uncharacterized protein n=1 Tax=Trichinella murrelli TaxID=144512 RepID=A0A0V0TP92_9BILA|nr:hypothetical protein T05_6290 [Trichinella murrelli]